MYYQSGKWKSSMSTKLGCKPVHYSTTPLGFVSDESENSAIVQPEKHITASTRIIQSMGVFTRMNNDIIDSVSVTECRSNNKMTLIKLESHAYRDQMFSTTNSRCLVTIRHLAPKSACSMLHRL
jgi:hypothetical protein